MRSIFGIQKAMVVSTKNFNTTGKITIMLESNSVEEPNECEVITPFGGIPNMGMIAIPPEGATGYVSFSQMKEDTPVWIGSVIQRQEFDDQENKHVPVESEEPSDFIIKTQYTHLEEKGGGELDDPLNKVENIIKMNENELTIAKVIQDDDNYEYKTEAYNMDDANYQILKFTDNEIKIKYKVSGTEDYSVIKLNSEGVRIEMSSDDGGVLNTLVMNSSGAQLDSNGTATIVVNGEDGSATITADKVILGADDDDAVKFSALRDFINQSYNSHTHGSPAGPTTPPVSPFTNTNGMKSGIVRLG